MPSAGPTRAGTAVRRLAASIAVPMVLGVAACQDVNGPDSGAKTAKTVASADEPTPVGRVPGRFIVTLRAGEDAAVVAREHGVTPDFVYTRALRGFAGTMGELARSGLVRDARVLRLEQDAVVSASDVQPASSWGLDRIDQRALPLNGSYQYNELGTGVTAYVVDTGIWFTHAQFNAPSGDPALRRAFPGYDAFGGQPYGDGVDCYGHGSHVAGTIGGNTVGVARGARLVAVRVLDCAGSGTWSGVIAGLDWILANAQRPAVVNMSLGGPATQAIDDAVAKLTSAGIPVVVAAGNSNADACTTSPARAPSALTIGASDSADNRASFSNWGSCVDWFAPGVSILSAYWGSDSRMALMSGTSMAAPHTAGVAALLLQLYPTLSPSAVADSLSRWTTKGVVKGANSAHNDLLFSLDQANTVTAPPDTIAPTPPDSVALPPPPPPPPPPIALTAATRKVKASRYVDLKWSGASTSKVDVLRNGTKLTTVANNGSYSDSLGKGGGSSFIYRVCDTGSTRCSADKAVTF